MFYLFINNGDLYIAKKISLKGGCYNMGKTLEKLKNKSAEMLVNEYNLDKTLPIDIVALTKNLGIELMGLNFNQIEQREPFATMVKERGHLLGATLEDGDDLIICYNTYDFPVYFQDMPPALATMKKVFRNRFTIAHEIGHCCLHILSESGYNLAFRTDATDYDNKKEREANIFAGELLIPKSLVDKVYNQINIVRVEDMAELFEVSNSVMKARLDYLNRPYITNFQSR